MAVIRELTLTPDSNWQKSLLKFVRQDKSENRTIQETLNLGWELLSILPKSELKRVKEEHIDKYMKV